MSTSFLSCLLLLRAYCRVDAIGWFTEQHGPTSTVREEQRELFSHSSTVLSLKTFSNSFPCKQQNQIFVNLVTANAIIDTDMSAIPMTRQLVRHIPCHIQTVN